MSAEPERPDRTPSRGPDAGGGAPSWTEGAVWFGFTAVVGWWALRGSMNADEGFYALVAKRVGEGQVPYRDFAYTQMPLLPYLNVLGHEVFGFTVAGGRWLNVVWALFGAGLLWACGRSFGGRASGAAAVAAFIGSGVPVGFSLGMGKTYAAAIALVLLGLAAVRSRLPRRLGWWLLVAGGTLAVGVRLTMAPSVFVLWAGFAWLHRRELRGVDLVAPLVVPGALLLPFFALAPENFVFWTFRYHTASLLPRHDARFWFEVLLYAGGLVPLAGAAVIEAVRPRGAGLRPAVVVFAAGGVGLVATIAVAGSYGEYLTPVLALLALGAAGCVGPAWSPRRLGGTVAAGAAVGLGIFAAGWSARPVIYETQLFAPSVRGDLREAADFLRTRTAADAVVEGPMVEVALEAGRAVAPGLEMGKFAMTTEFPVAVARERHLLHWHDLVARARSAEADAWVLSKWRSWNFSISVPSMGILAKENHRELTEALLDRYEPAFSNASFVIYLKRPAPGAPVPPAPPPR